jgi:hypothetical protein
MSDDENEDIFTLNDFNDDGNDESFLYNIRNIDDYNYIIDNLNYIDYQSLENINGRDFDDEYLKACRDRDLEEIERLEEELDDTSISDAIIMRCLLISAKQGDININRHMLNFELNGRVPDALIIARNEDFGFSTLRRSVDIQKSQEFCIIL